MRWVKFSERFPTADDKLSVSSEDEVVVRGKFSNGDFYCGTAELGHCHDYGVDMKAEWLEGAFEVEVKP